MLFTTCTEGQCFILKVTKFFWMMLLTKKNITRVTRMTLIYDKEEKDFNALYCSFWKLFCKYSLKFMYVSIFKYQLINDNFLWKKIQWWVLHLFNNIFFTLILIIVYTGTCLYIPVYLYFNYVWKFCSRVFSLSIFFLLCYTHMMQQRKHFIF